MLLVKKIETCSLESLLKVMIFVFFLINVLGFLPPLMDVDSTLYASISKNMMQKNDWINLYYQDKDWLDKPHFQMWISAFFYKIFGINAFAFRIASFIFFIIGIIYTYKLSKLFFKSSSNIIPLLSVLILISAQHILLSNYDVKAEIIIMGLLVASMYHLIRREERFFHLLLAAFFMGCAMMTKGIYLLIPALSLWFFGAMRAKDFIFFIRWRFIVFILLILLFITPELVCLYLQFDNHYDKIVFGKTGVSGIKFFFWDSQFGRFTNTGPIKGKGDIFFFLHTLLWAFFPWSLLFYFSCFKERKKIFKDAMILKLMAIIVPMFLIFSVSRFQLPHYIIILFPFFAILTAKYILSSSYFQNHKPQLIFTLTQIFAFAVLIFIGVIITLYFGFTTQTYIILCFDILALIVFIILWKHSNFNKFILQIMLVVVFVNTILFTQFYPHLLQYQYGYTVNKYLEKYPSTKLIILDNLSSPSMQFYSAKKLLLSDTIPIQPDTCFILCNSTNRKNLSNQWHTIKAFPTYHVSRLKIKFVNHRTRYKTLDSVYLFSNYPISKNYE